MVAITHDDRYFADADRIIKLEEGKVVETFRHEALQEASPGKTCKSEPVGEQNESDCKRCCRGRRTGLVGARYYWCGGLPAGRSFRTLPVSRGDLFDRRHRHGTVEPVEIDRRRCADRRQHQELRPRSGPARQDDRLPLPGQAGTVLAQLDDLPHRAEVDKARANLRLAEAELNAIARGRSRRSATSTAPSSCAIRIPRPQYENAMAEMEIAKADLAMAEAKVEQAKIALKQAEINLGYTTIRSPDRRRGDRPPRERRPDGGGRDERPQPVSAGQGSEPHAGLGRRERSRHRRRRRSGRR